MWFQVVEQLLFIYYLCPYPYPYSTKSCTIFKCLHIFWDGNQLYCMYVLTNCITNGQAWGNLSFLASPVWMTLLDRIEKKHVSSELRERGLLLVQRFYLCFFFLFLLCVDSFINPLCSPVWHGVRFLIKLMVLDILLLALSSIVLLLTQIAFASCQPSK